MMFLIWSVLCASARGNNRDKDLFSQLSGIPPSFFVTFFPMSKENLLESRRNLY